MRTEIERWLLIVLLGLGYLSQVPGLARHGMVGLPALAIGLVVTLLLVLLLKRSSSAAALFIAALAALALGLRLIGHFLIEPHLARGVPQSDFAFVAQLAGTMIMAFMAMDLWSGWRKNGAKTPRDEAVPRS